jgi:hypothetical protein
MLMFYTASGSIDLAIGSLFVMIAGNCSIATLSIIFMVELGKRAKDRTN